MKKYILGIDEGTTSTRAVLYSIEEKKIIAIYNKKFTQIFPKSGLVEHNAEEIYNAVLETIEKVLEKANASINEVLSIGITNQRETVVAWDKQTLKPLHNAIVWQCRRTSKYCENLPKFLKTKIRQKTGLLVDSYFSGTKIKWLLDNIQEIKELNEKNQICFGTIDAFLIAKLTNGKVFATDVTNASRTMLFNIHTLEWDDELLEYFDIKKSSLPNVLECADDYGIAEIFGEKIPITGVIGDQQSSLFGQGCFNKGLAKNTIGTGCFILVNIGDKLKIEQSNMLSTVAWKLNGQVSYALEGSVFNAGSSIDWAKNGVKLFEDYTLIDSCMETKFKDRIYFVPALTGLGAPYWKSDARGMICGLNRGTTNIDILRAVVESIVFSSNDILEDSMEISRISELYCDGGVSVNTNLLQFLADITGLKIVTENDLEATALGAIYMSGIKMKVFNNLKDIKKLISIKDTYKPKMDPLEREEILHGWKNAVKLCITE